LQNLWRAAGFEHGSSFVKFRSLILFVRVVISGAEYVCRQSKLEGDPAMKLNAEQLLLVSGLMTDERIGSVVDNKRNKSSRYLTSNSLW
jgi:hypothetical protein